MIQVLGPDLYSNGKDHCLALYEICDPRTTRAVIFPLVINLSTSHLFHHCIGRRWHYCVIPDSFFPSFRVRLYLIPTLLPLPVSKGIGLEYSKLGFVPFHVSFTTSTIPCPAEQVPLVAGAGQPALNLEYSPSDNGPGFVSLRNNLLQSSISQFTYPVFSATCFNKFAPQSHRPSEGSPQFAESDAMIE